MAKNKTDTSTVICSHEQATYATTAIWYLLQGYMASKMQQTGMNRKLFIQSKNTPSTRQKHKQQCWSRILENVLFQRNRGYLNSARSKAFTAA